MDTVTGCLKAKISVRRDIHSRPEGGGVEPEHFRPGYASTKSLHKDGYWNQFL